MVQVIGLDVTHECIQMIHFPWCNSQNLLYLFYIFNQDGDPPTVQSLCYKIVYFSFITVSQKFLWYFSCYVFQPFCWIKILPFGSQVPNV